MVARGRFVYPGSMTELDVKARLAGRTFENETFEKLDLSGFDFAKKELTNCTFRGCKLPETKWGGTTLEDCQFDTCDLSNCVPKRVSLLGVEFKNSKLMGAKWLEVGSSPRVGFTDCAMRYQSFVGLDLRSTSFVRCAIVESAFIDVNLGKAKFEDCELTKTEFERCELLGTDFASSHGVFFDTAQNRIKGARINTETAALIAAGLGLVVSTG
jgi:uncharacterized protein YjbI with pentapeptide repeats